MPKIPFSHCGLHNGSSNSHISQTLPLTYEVALEQYKEKNLACQGSYLNENYLFKDYLSLESGIAIWILCMWTS